MNLASISPTRIIIAVFQALHTSPTSKKSSLEYKHKNKQYMLVYVDMLVYISCRKYLNACHNTDSLRYSSKLFLGQLRPAAQVFPFKYLEKNLINIINLITSAY